MTDMTIPAPVSGSTDSAAPQVTGQDATTKPQNAPQATRPDGSAPQAEKPDGESPATQDAASGEDPSQDEDKPKTWKERRAERNRERWQEYKSAREGALARMSRLEAEVTRLKSAQPDFSNITDPTEELAERTAHKVRQGQAADLEREAKEHASEARNRMLQQWEIAKEEARERLPDFDKVYTDRTPLHPRAAQHIVDSDKGADIAYFLGKNPDVANQLYDKFERSPAAALIELGRIEARLSVPAAKTVSTAPKPAPVLSGGTNPAAFDVKSASIADTATELRKLGLIR